MKKSKISIVKDFVKQINPDYRVKYSNQFECNPIEEIVYINFRHAEDANDLFSKFCQEQFGKSYNAVLISLLHEIGHIETFDDDLDEERGNRYALLQYLWDNSDIDRETLHFEYFRLPSEIEATTWAVEFIENNAEMCENFLKMLDISA